MYSYKYDNTVIYLIGFPGTGKLTIAKLLQERIQQSTLVDNHLINNPIFSLIDIDGETKLPQRVWDNTERIWAAVFDTLIHLTPPENTILITNALAEDDQADHAQFCRVQDMAKERGACFIPIRLTCDLPELKRRIQSPGRKENMKDTSPENASKLFRSTQVLDPAQFVPRYHYTHPLELDVSALKAVHACEHLCQNIEAITKKMHCRPERQAKHNVINQKREDTPKPKK